MLHRDNGMEQSDWLLCVLPFQIILPIYQPIFCCFLLFLSWLMGTMTTMMTATATMTGRTDDCKQQAQHGGT